MSQMTDLSHTLWRQRRLLEHLLYRVEVQHLMLAANRTRWITTATRDVEQVMEQLREEELTRAVQVRGVAAELGLHDEPSLAQLIASAPAPWDEILKEHQAAFLSMTAELEDLTKQNRELLTRGYQATRDLLAAITDGAGSGAAAGYSAAGSFTSFAPPPSTIDRIV